MFDANKKLDDDDEGGKPAFGVVVSMGKHKPASFNPSAKLDEESGEEEQDAEGRYKEAVAILANMINRGRVDEEKLGRCLREAFEALEEEPHKEYEHEKEEEA